MRKKYRIAVLCLLILAAVFLAFGFGLIDRWYGQIVGDTFKVESRLMTQFRNEPTKIRSFVVVPISAKEHPEKRFPVMYHLHGFGADYMDASEEASALRIRMRRHPETEMIHVYLDASLGDGYHYFVNSETTGPWEDALMQDFIPSFERVFPVVAEPSARFLTGHSSGGWSALWLQVRHPEFFGGVWSVSPDPVDFSNFFGIDITPGSQQNFYKDRHGKLRMVARSGKLRNTTLRDYVAEDEEDAERCDGDFGSYECAWSIRGTDGLPLPLFNRATGVIDPEVARVWERYDISKILKNKETELLPKLQKKLHLFCGANDDFFLEKPFLQLCAYLKSKGMAQACELVPSRGHGDMYLATKKSPLGLEYRIDTEAEAIFSAAHS